MSTFVINGKFMADRMQGIVRYARELVKALDLELTDEIQVTLLIPCDARDIPELKNINVQYYGKRTGILWEQCDLRRYMQLHKEAICINLCNVVPFFIRPGITTIHDIMYKVNPSHYTTLRNRVSRYWHILQYSYIVRHEKKILTVSQFSKGEIERHYPQAEGKIEVINNAWQHVQAYKESEDWEERYPFLKPGAFYFSLATLAKNKNGKWIIEAAKHNKDSVFAIAGKHYETESVLIPDNVHMLGFVSDEDACSLIKNCKAFIFPSVYEGFGLPPLEALALGARVISSNAASLPEVLEESVYYISPNDENVDLEVLLGSSINAPEKTLERYSWAKSADALISIMQSF